MNLLELLEQHSLLIILFNNNNIITITSLEGS